MDAKPAAHGIEALIGRLHGEGVEAGRREAQRIQAEARETAEKIVAAARAQAESLQAEARRAAQAEREAMGHAFDLARRDALLALKEALCVQLAARLQRAVGEVIADPEQLRRILLAAVNGADEAVRREVDSLLATTAAAMLAEGVSLPAESGRIGVRLLAGDIVVEVTDQTLAELLAAHLIPRFRARLDGATHE